jgi:hypothetical protein
MPARFAARIFSLIPPTGRTLPRSVISPVIAKYGLIVLLVNKELRVESKVIPADGPSFGIAPSGI